MFERQPTGSQEETPWPVRGSLNARATRVVDGMVAQSARLGIDVREVPGGGRLIDVGQTAPGGLTAGLEVARVCLADLADVALVPGELAGVPTPIVVVRTDHPVGACMASQYAGWHVGAGAFSAMTSGPIRAAACREAIFETPALADWREPVASHSAMGDAQTLTRGVAPPAFVGVMETRRTPGPEVLAVMAAKLGVSTQALTVVVAPTGSLAGAVQIVARCVETALHKLHELGFDLRRVRSALGSAPLPPVGRDDLTALGRTNDAILYAGRVVLYIGGDDQSLADVGPAIPSMASADYGQPFLSLFERAGRDFYKIDARLFSPAEVVLVNLDTGNSHRFGAAAPAVAAASFGYR